MSYNCHCEERGVRRGNLNDMHGEVGDCRTKNVRNDKLKKILQCDISYAYINSLSIRRDEDGLMDVIDLRDGMIFEYGGNIYTVMSAVHTHQQQRRGLVRLKAKDIKTGKVLQDTFRSDIQVKPVYVDEVNLVYLYADGNDYHFMDNSTYEQFIIAAEVLGDTRNYMRENLEVTGLFHNGKILDIKMPITVDLTVIEAEPGHKGDTVQGGKKKARLETGMTIQTPLFIEAGDKVKVDTRTGEYVTRV